MRESWLAAGCRRHGRGTHMSDEEKRLEEDVEGHRVQKLAEDDTEGHRVQKEDSGDDTEGHRIQKEDMSGDDTEGHRIQK
jgi:hypothetical protein